MGKRKPARDFCGGAFAIRRSALDSDTDAGSQGSGNATALEGSTMLVLTRSTSERVMIGDDVIVKVVSVAGNRVRLAFEAPREVSIDREETRRDKETHGLRRS